MAKKKKKSHVIYQVYQPGGSKYVKTTGPVRELKRGGFLPETEDEVEMTITSKCPDKWLFADMETGDIWHITQDGKRRGKKLAHPFWRVASKKELMRLGDTVLQKLLDRDWLPEPNHV